MQQQVLTAITWKWAIASMYRVWNSKRYIKLLWALNCFLGCLNSLIVHPKNWAETPLQFLSVYKLPTQELRKLPTPTTKWSYKFGQTYQKISSMNGSHLHRLPHLNFQLFHYKFFCSANFFLCGPISNWTYFCNNPTQNKKNRRT